MERLPASWLDFSDALKLLSDSQKDVTELVTKWSDIMDTETPRTVDVTLTDGSVHKVDNLAKIRRDLIAGLSLENPVVTTLGLRSYRANGSITATYQYGLEYQNEGATFDKLGGFTGVYRSLYNDLWTAAIPSASKIRVNLQAMPRIVMLGVDYQDGTDVIDNLEISINPPSSSYVNNGVMAEGKHYCTIVTLVNHNYGMRDNAYYEGPVTVTLKSSEGIYSSNVYTVTLQPKKSASFLLFAPAGGQVVNIQEIQPNEA